MMNWVILVSQSLFDVMRDCKNFLPGLDLAYEYTIFWGELMTGTAPFTDLLTGGRS